MEFIAHNHQKNNDMEHFIKHCDEALHDMKDVSDMKYYSCVGLCAFDAVFSIRSGYKSVVSPLIDRFCRLLKIDRNAPDPSSIPGINEQIMVSDLRSRLKGHNAESLADAIGNHQRTSTSNGILKTEAFLNYLEVFGEYDINTFQDVNRLAVENPGFEHDLKSIKGQNVAVGYFFMLAGDTDRVKVDVHLKRFAKDALGHEVEDDEIKRLFAEAVSHYRKNGYPDMTARQLDHTVWTWQRSR